MSSRTTGGASAPLFTIDRTPNSSGSSSLVKRRGSVGNSGRRTPPRSSAAQSMVSSNSTLRTAPTTRAVVGSKPRKKTIVYPPPRSIHSSASTGSSGARSHTDAFSFSSNLDIIQDDDNELDQSEPFVNGMDETEKMTMKQPLLPQRQVFPSEEAVAKDATTGGVNDVKTPEVCMHPTPHQPNQQLLSDEDLDAVGQFIIQGSCVGVAIWLFLLLNTFFLAPEDSYRMLEGGERQATWTIVILLFATNTTRIVPLAFHKNGFHFFKSGIIVGSFTVQFIAIVSNWIMVNFPTPVMTDPITGMRIHLMRFAVWTPLSFLMTFLTEAIDLNWQSRASVQQSFSSHSYQVAWWHAAFMALSTVAGAIFPFCKNVFVWWEVMIISWILFGTIYLRFYQRYQRYKQLEKQQKQQLPNTKSKQTRGPNFLLNEAVDRSRMSFQLIVLCTVTWTFIAGTFTVCCFLPKYVEKDSMWANPELPLIIGTILEAISKVYYLTMQLHVYEKVFDESARSARRLEEMRTLMSALWEASSDILVICAETDSFIHAVISPHYLLQSTDLDDPFANTSPSSTMLEISKYENTFVSFPMNLSEPVTRRDAQRIQSQRMRQFNMDYMERDTTRGKNLAILAKLAKKACQDDQSWQTGGAASWPIQEMLEYNPDTEEEYPVTCEAKVTAIESGGVLVVLRDVSERYQRFEVEKQLLEEVIVRKKDAEAIRFTRHEVKNGLLAAIGIVDGLKEQQKKKNTSPSPEDDAHMDDLDSALKEILEAILDNAMIREVVYEGYVPRMESVNLPELLDPAQRQRSSCGGANASENSKRQFPLFASPEPFPHLVLDPQLIRKIYQNAVSNACKYGKKDGDVKTFLTYDSGSHIFRMEVSNLPGYNHEELLKLSEEVTESVFHESTQLQVNQQLDTKEGKLASARSSGDGAWIMRKCAQCLGGTCHIEYTPSGTTLTFECPATVSEDWKKKQLSRIHENFAVPPSTWAIAVEDSPMQRKLLDRFLKQAGFLPEKCVVLGKTADEIYGFTDTIRELMKEHENDKFVCVIDENLDIVEGGTVTNTVSGSFSIHQLRKSLSDEEEDRMLALIRSANDSVQEVEMYQSRAHGFLLKGPMKKGGLLEEIKPWWIRRFHEGNGRRSRRGRKKGGDQSGSSSTMKKTLSDLSLSESSQNGGDFAVTAERIMDFVRDIDALCGYRPHDTGGASDSGTVSSHSCTGDWQPIRYKLLLLNIDLKMNAWRDLLALASKNIDDLTSKGGSAGAPDQLLYKWMEIRDLITQGVADGDEDD